MHLVQTLCMSRVDRPMSQILAANFGSGIEVERGECRSEKAKVRGHFRSQDDQTKCRSPVRPTLCEACRCRLRSNTTPITHSGHHERLHYISARSPTRTSICLYALYNSRLLIHFDLRRTFSDPHANVVGNKHHLSLTRLKTLGRQCSERTQS